MLTGKMTGNLQRRSNNKDLKEELEIPFFNVDALLVQQITFLYPIN
jgi:hypothetical protein